MPAISSENFSWLDKASMTCHPAGRAEKSHMAPVSDLPLLHQPWNHRIGNLKDHLVPKERECFSLSVLWRAGGNWQLQSLGDVNWVFWTTLINSLCGTAANTETTGLWRDGSSSKPDIWGPPPCKTPRGGKENRTLPCVEAWFRWALLITCLPCGRNRKEKGDIYCFAVLQEELISASQMSGSLVQRPLQTVSSPCAWLHTLWWL